MHHLDDDDIEKITSALAAQYSDCSGRYERLCRELQTQLEELLKSSSIMPALPIHGRVKSWESIANKVVRNQLSPTELSEISDLAGLRVVLLFERDVAKVTEMIERTLKVVSKEDTRDRLGVGEFGYGSIHFIAETPDSWLSVPSLSSLGGLQCEIQVRTASQHIWAAASHALQYKQEQDVPIPLRRSINRAAALLEVIDIEFERVLQNRADYIKTPRAFVDEELNVDTLRQVLDEVWPAPNKMGNEDYSELLGLVLNHGIRSAEELKSALASVKDEVLRYDSAYADAHPNLYPERAGCYFQHVGLTRAALEFRERGKFLRWPVVPE